MYIVCPISNDKEISWTHRRYIYCIINYRHVRRGLTSLNNSFGDFEDESKAVRDQMQIRFISVKPGVEGRVACTTPQRKHCRVNLRSRRVVIAWLYQPLLAFIFFAKYICTLCKRSLYFVYSRTRKYLKIVLSPWKLNWNSFFAAIITKITTR